MHLEYLIAAKVKHLGFRWHSGSATAILTDSPMQMDSKRHLGSATDFLKAIRSGFHSATLKDSHLQIPKVIPKLMEIVTDSHLAILIMTRSDFPKDFLSKNRAMGLLMATPKVKVICSDFRLGFHLATRSDSPKDSPMLMD